MASSSSVAIKRASSSPLFSKLFNPIRSASVSRSFNTNTPQTANVGDDDRSVAVDRRSSSDRPTVSRRRESAPSIFSGVFDPFSPAASLSQVLNLMDRLMDDPLLSRATVGGGGSRLPWSVKEDENALHLRIDMPGMDKEHVKVCVEQNTLIIKGEAEKQSEEEEEEEEAVGRYSSRLDLPPNLYKLDEIKAEMKNGVLKVVVPKVKPEERKDVHEVKVE